MSEQKFIPVLRFHWLFSIIVLLSSCTKDKTAIPVIAFQCNAQTTVTYSQNIKPILDQHCALSGCHLGANSSGIFLDNYLAAKTEFQSGNSLCTIHHNAGCKAMPYPPSSDKLPDSLIAVIDCWTQKGFPN